MDKKVYKLHYNSWERVPRVVDLKKWYYRPSNRYIALLNNYRTTIYNLMEALEKQYYTYGSITLFGEFGVGQLLLDYKGAGNRFAKWYRLVFRLKNNIKENKLRIKK